MIKPFEIVLGMVPIIRTHITLIRVNACILYGSTFYNGKNMVTYGANEETNMLV